MLSSRIEWAAAVMAVLATTAFAQPGDGSIRRERAEAPEADAPRLVLETRGFTTVVNGIGFSTDGRWLAAAGSDKAVRIWDLETGQLRSTLRGQEGIGGLGSCTAVAFAPGGRELVVGVHDFNPEGNIRVYRASEPEEIAELLPGHPQGGVAELAFSEDGDYLASVGSDRRSIIIWQWATRRPLHRLSTPGTIRYVGFPVKDLPVLATIDTQGTGLWSALHGKAVGELAPAQLAELLGDASKQRALAGFLPRMSETMKAFKDLKAPYSGVAQVMRTYLDSGHILAGGVGKEPGRYRYWVGLWSAAGGGRPVRVYEGHRYFPATLSLSPDRALVASADILGEIRVWEVRTGRTRYHFNGAGRPIYKVGFDDSGRSLAFGSKSFGADRFTFNSYAELDEAFDLEDRRLLEGAPGKYRTEVTRRGPLSIAPEADPKKGGYNLVVRRGGKVEGRRHLVESTPLCFTLLGSAKLGFPDPIVVGTDGSLACWDPKTMLTRREFAGHLGLVNSVSESPDGRFLASGSSDRTIRIWSLENFRDWGWPDFEWDADDGDVSYIAPGGFAERAGVRVGDRFVRMDGRDNAALVERVLGDRWEHRPGQRATLDMLRGDRPYRVTVALAPGGDLAEPILSLFCATDGEWVLWTPQGYYDASPGGDRLIGWHANQGRARAAKFYLAHQFRKRFYRPDVIDRVLQAGDVPRAIALANADRARPAEALDLRQPDVLSRLEPPRVRILEPADGARTRTARVTVRAEAEAQNDLPISKVTVLLNGRPSAGRGTVRETGDAGRRRTVVQAVDLVPGRNEVGIVATNRESSSQPATVSVTYEAPESELIKPKLYVLAVGISKYARRELNLDFAHRDAEAFAAAWKSQEGPVYAEVHTRVLTDEQAGAANIRDGMDWLAQGVTQHDVAILFLSAHGTHDNSNNYYLATHELDEKRLRATAIPYSDITRLIQEDLYCKILLFVDTCHAGGVTGTKTRALGDDPLRDLVSDEVGAVVFASSTPRELSEESPRWGHGAFTRAILDAMGDPASDLNRDGYLSITEMDYQISERVKSLTRGRQHPVTQKPPSVRDLPISKAAPPGGADEAAETGLGEGRQRD